MILNHRNTLFHNISIFYTTLCSLSYDKRGNTFMKIKKYHTENIKYLTQKQTNTDTFYTQIYYSSNTGTFTVFRISDHLNYENLLVKIECITKKLV